jgi:thiol-disulfide isomerase/thioredoxin
MDDKPEYFDFRSAFWKSAYETALEYERYLAQSPSGLANRWLDTANTIPPLEDDQKQSLTGYNRILRVLMVCGVWCGDCMRQGPIIKRIVEACDDGVELRVMDRDANPEVRDELRILGAMRVPVVVFLTEDFFEVGRFGDQMLTTYRKMAANAIGRAAPQDEGTSELSEWVDIFERMLLMARLSPFLRNRHGD